MKTHYFYIEDIAAILGIIILVVIITIGGVAMGFNRYQNTHQLEITNKP